MPSQSHLTSISIDRPETVRSVGRWMVKCVIIIKTTCACIIIQSCMCGVCIMIHTIDSNSSSVYVWLASLAGLPYLFVTFAYKTKFSLTVSCVQKDIHT